MSNDDHTNGEWLQTLDRVAMLQDLNKNQFKTIEKLNKEIAQLKKELKKATRNQFEIGYVD